MAAIAYDHATRLYPGTERPAVDALDLEVEDGELLVLVGPSGSGKSTALRMLAGLEEVDDGRIEIGGRDVTGLSPKDRDIAMVFQSYALYPHMTVAQNMGFALKLGHVPRDEIDRRVREAATLLDLDGLLGRKPRQLSGGQRQRVAMGRAIVRHPQAFLMDEPLSNLDAKLRVQTRTQIAALQRELRTTTVYVTHDQVEAMTMGDRVAVLKDGALQQVAAPRDMYRAPANVFVAGFMGSPSMNLLEATLTERGAACGPVVVDLPPDLMAAASRDGSPTITLGFRPEAVVAAGDDGFPLVVDVVEDLGSDAYVHGAVSVDGAAVPLVARVDPARLPEKGDGLRLRVLPAALHVFSTTTGERLAGHPPV